MRRVLPFAVFASPLLLCCESSSSASPGASPAAASVGGPEVAGSAAPVATTVPAVDGDRCHEGTWSLLDWKGQTQELLEGAGVKDMKVVGATGDGTYTFESQDGKSGTYTVVAGGDGMTMTIENPLGGKTQRTTVRMSGSISGTYDVVSLGNLRLSPPTKNDFEAKATVSVGGKAVELPDFEVPSEAWLGTVEVTCKGDQVRVLAKEAARFFDGIVLKKK